MTDRSIPAAPTTSTPLQDQLRDLKINKPHRGGSRLKRWSRIPLLWFCADTGRRKSSSWWFGGGAAGEHV